MATETELTSDLVSGGLSFTGLGSGIDFNTMIDQLIQVESIQKARMEIWKADWEEKITAFQDLNTKLLSLKSTLDGMDTMSEFLTKTTSSSNSTVLTAKADSDAEEGTHSIQVLQLAKNAILTNQQGFSAATSKVTTSDASFTYNYKGTDYTLAVSANTTLEGIKNLINTDPNNDGVRASIISDGSKYYLQMRGLDMGSDADLSISGSTTLTNFKSTDFDVSQLNQDSKIKVDGWPASDAWIQTDSNSISGIINGVTLNLKSMGDSSPATVSLTIATDKEGIKENIRTFVQQMNEVRSLIRDMTKFNETTQEGSVLTGNYGIQLIDSQLKSAVAGKATGFNYTDDTFASMSALGILTNADRGSLLEGLLELDEETLDAAMDYDLDAVAQVFAADGIGDEKVTAGSFSYYNHVQGITEAGEYSVSYQIDGSGNIISNTAFINGRRANVDNSTGTITALSGASKGIVIQVNDFTPGSTGSGTVRVKSGKISELSDLLKGLTSTEEGPLNILEDNYQDIIDNIDKKIAREEDRLTKMEYNLKQKFARLEATLGYYDQLSGSLGNQIDQLE